MEVLVERPSKKSPLDFSGRNSENCKVVFPKENAPNSKIFPQVLQHLMVISINMIRQFFILIKQLIYV